MGVSTIGFVALPEGYKADVFEVMDLVEAALKDLDLEGKKIYVQGANLFNRSIFIPFMVCSQGLNYIQAKKDETTIHRRLMVNFDCHTDQSDIYEGNKLIFSLDDANVSRDVIKAILKAFTNLGTCYFVPNDCEDYHEVIKA